MILPPAKAEYANQAQKKTEVQEMSLPHIITGRELGSHRKLTHLIQLSPSQIIMIHSKKNNNKGITYQSSTGSQEYCTAQHIIL